MVQNTAYSPVTQPLLYVFFSLLLLFGLSPSSSGQIFMPLAGFPICGTELLCPSLSDEDLPSLHLYQTIPAWLNDAIYTHREPSDLSLLKFQFFFFFKESTSVGRVCTIQAILLFQLMERTQYSKYFGIVDNLKSHTYLQL